MLWDAGIGIGDANLLIQNASASTSTSAAIKKAPHWAKAISSVRTISPALVQPMGAVPLKNHPESTTVELEFT